MLCDDQAVNVNIEHSQPTQPGNEAGLNECNANDQLHGREVAPCDLEHAAEERLDDIELTNESILKHENTHDNSILEADSDVKLPTIPKVESVNNYENDEEESEIVISEISLVSSNPQVEDSSSEIIPYDDNLIEDIDTLIEGHDAIIQDTTVPLSPDNDNCDSFNSFQPSLKSTSATPPAVHTWVWGSSLPDKRFSKRSKRKGRLSMLESQSVCSDLERDGSMFSLSPDNFSASLNDIDKIVHSSTYEHLINELEDVKSLNTELAEKLFRNSNSMLDYEHLKSSSIVLNDDNKKIKEENYKLIQEKKTLELHKDIEISDLEKNVLKLMSDLEIANKTIRHVSEESEKKIKAVEDKYEAKIAHIDKKFIETIKEKDILSSSLDETRAARTKLAASKETFIKTLSSKTEELERLRAKLNFSMEDCIKLKHESDERAGECKKLAMELKNTKDELSSAAIKIQWANRSLKSETDAHQLTRQKLSGMDAKIRESKEEADMIRANCQAMINKYQNSEEIQSNALGNKLDKLEEEHKALNSKYDALAKDFQDQTEEMRAQNKATETIKNQLFDKEAQYQSLLEEFRSTASEKDNAFNQLEDLDEQLNSYNDLKTELKNSYETNQDLTKQVTELREELKSLNDGWAELNDKERSNMDYFQKISTKNADLQLEVNSLRLEGEGLHRQVDAISAERNEIYDKFSSLTITHDTLSEETSQEIAVAKAEIEQLQSTKACLETRIEELINEAAVAKKKHTSGNKDLVRQIEQFRKQIEKQEESMRRSESINSLIDKDRALSGASSEADDSLSISGDSGATVSFEQARVMLIERLCHLQKQLAKRQEKIEFCESHISTLTRDIQKKSQVIQSLLLRVETGSRTSLASDAYKAGQDNSGILGNLYGSKSNGMTLKLSTEINEKLQQVLEDTLFKNITLTENIKTLGEEIDRLNSLQRSK